MLKWRVDEEHVHECARVCATAISGGARLSDSWGDTGVRLSASWGDTGVRLSASWSDTGGELGAHSRNTALSSGYTCDTNGDLREC